MSITEGHGEGLMAQNLLNRRYIYPGHDQLRYNSMPQVMEVQVQQTSPFACRLEAPLDPLVRLS